MHQFYLVPSSRIINCDVKGCQVEQKKRQAGQEGGSFFNECGLIGMKIFESAKYDTSIILTSNKI